MLWIIDGKRGTLFPFMPFCRLPLPKKSKIIIHNPVTGIQSQDAIIRAFSSPILLILNKNESFDENLCLFSDRNQLESRTMQVTFMMYWGVLITLDIYSFKGPSKKTGCQIGKNEDYIEE
ncbi:MAG: hypothetical protein ABFD91_11015 [Anaerohalosphaeraceae bacterium]